MLNKGDKVVNFTAILSNGEIFNLYETLKKKMLVIFFYPKNFSPFCTKEVCLFRDNYHKITDNEAFLIGVSSNSMESHLEFIIQNQLSFPLISDEDNKIGSIFGILRLGGILPSKRATFIIDRNAEILYTGHFEFEIQNHIEEVINIIENMN